MLIDMDRKGISYRLGSYPRVREFATLLARLEATGRWEGSEFCGYTNPVAGEPATRFLLPASPRRVSYFVYSRRLAVSPGFVEPGSGVAGITTGTGGVVAGLWRDLNCGCGADECLSGSAVRALWPRMKGAQHNGDLSLRHQAAVPPAAAPWRRQPIAPALACATSGRAFSMITRAARACCMPSSWCQKARASGPEPLCGTLPREPRNKRTRGRHGSGKWRCRWSFPWTHSGIWRSGSPAAWSPSTAARWT